jgi:hypothetical protein
VTTRSGIAQRAIYRRVLDLEPGRGGQGQTEVAGVQGELAGVLGERQDDRECSLHLYIHPTHAAATANPSERVTSSRVPRWHFLGDEFEVRQTRPG